MYLNDRAFLCPENLSGYISQWIENKFYKKSINRFLKLMIQK